MNDVAGPSVRCFSEVTPDAKLHFQVIDLGRQLYVWVGTQPKLANMFFAIKSPAVSRGSERKACTTAWSSILCADASCRPGPSPAHRLCCHPWRRCFLQMLLRKPPVLRSA